MSPIPVLLEMNIRYFANGTLTFKGAPDDPVLFYGVIETLKESYARMRAEHAARKGQSVQAEPQRIIGANGA